jgi:malate dehydrogenase (quinone)
MDLPLSIKTNNIFPMLSAGVKNIPLTKYLIDQVRQSPEDRLEALREYLPAANLEDWELEIAGQRVQVIKKDEKEGGVLEFGTEVVSAADGSIAALLAHHPVHRPPFLLCSTFLGVVLKIKLKQRNGSQN